MGWTWIVNLNELKAFINSFYKGFILSTIGSRFCRVSAKSSAKKKNKLDKISFGISDKLNFNICCLHEQAVFGFNAGLFSVCLNHVVRIDYGRQSF